MPSSCGQPIIRSALVGPVLRKPASKSVTSASSPGKNADREFGRHGIVWAIERDRCGRPAPESSLGPFAVRFSGLLRVGLAPPVVRLALLLRVLVGHRWRL